MGVRLTKNYFYKATIYSSIDMSKVLSIESGVVELHTDR